MRHHGNYSEITRPASKQRNAAATRGGQGPLIISKKFGQSAPFIALAVEQRIATVSLGRRITPASARSLHRAAGRRRGVHHEAQAEKIAIRDQGFQSTFLSPL
jgi:hypothetical protein